MMLVVVVVAVVLSGVENRCYCYIKHPILNISVRKAEEKLNPVSQPLKNKLTAVVCTSEPQLAQSPSVTCWARLQVPDCSLLPLASSLSHRCALSQSGQRDLSPPQQPVTAPHKPSSVFLLCSITVLLHHLREQFNHLWPNPSFNDVRTLQGPPAPYKRLFSQFVFSPCRVHTKTHPAGFVCVDQMHVCVNIPCSFSPFCLFWELDQLLVCLWVHVGRVRRKQSMCQENHMALLGYRHLPLDLWESFQNHYELT